MNDNIERIIGVFISLCALIIAFGLLFVNVDRIDDLCSVYENRYYHSDIIIDDGEIGNLISREQARSLVGELVLLNFREQSTKQYVYYEGMKIDLTKPMKIPELYLGDSCNPVDFSVERVELDKSYYEFSYEYSNQLEISGYRLK